MSINDANERLRFCMKEVPLCAVETLFASLEKTRWGKKLTRDSQLKKKKLPGVVAQIFSYYHPLFKGFECVSSEFGVSHKGCHSSDKQRSIYRSSGPIRNNGPNKNCSISPHLSNCDSGGNAAPI